MNYTFAILKDKEDMEKAENFINLASDYMLIGKNTVCKKLEKLFKTVLEKDLMENHIFEKDGNTIILWRKYFIKEKAYIKTYPVMYMHI